MDIFNILSLFGGLSFFLYGMRMLSGGLENIAGGRLEATLRRLTNKPVKGLLLGAVITAAIQSSSAVTVMLVGLVNSGIMTFSRTIPVIMGSNVGTTVTAWILSLSGIEGDSLAVRLLKPENFAPIAALVGIVLLTISKRKGRREIGTVLIGFAVLMSGMTLMSDSVKPLAELEGFRESLLLFTNPLLGILVGAVFTGIIQSSSASVGILQALSLTGRVNYSLALPIVIGQNIGTCVTALLSSIGVGRSARKVALFHVLFNLIGAAVTTALIYGFDLAIDFALFDRAADPVGIAIAHTLFNVFSTIVLFPARNVLDRLTDKLLKPDSNETDTHAPFIDERLLTTPSVAVSECDRLGDEMARLARSISIEAVALYGADGKSREGSHVSILEGERRLDKYEDIIGSFLVKLSSKKITSHASNTVSKLFRSIGDFERIGDHSQNLVESREEINSKSIVFSQPARRELDLLARALREIIDRTFEAYAKDDVSEASLVEPLEQVIDSLIKKIRENHIKRLRDGACTIVHGFVLSDVLNDFERISDHCSNIAVTLIESRSGRNESHEYLKQTKREDNRRFLALYKEFYEKFKL